MLLVFLCMLGIVIGIILLIYGAILLGTSAVVIAALMALVGIVRKVATN